MSTRGPFIRRVPEHLSHRTEEVENLQHKLDYLDFQHQTTLDTLNNTQKEKKKLQDETKELIYKYEKHAKEQESIAEEKMKDLLKELFATIADSLKGGPRSGTSVAVRGSPVGRPSACEKSCSVLESL